MSTVTTTYPAPISIPVRSQSFSTLIGVEIRKMTSVRSTWAIFAVTLAIAGAGITYKLINLGDTATPWSNMWQIFQGVIFVLPLIGLLAMTSEWTQRTALTTFSLSPRRGRVFGAKYVAAASLSLIALASVIVLLVAATWVGGLLTGTTPSFDGFGESLRVMAIITLLDLTMAAGFGAVAAHTAVAVAAYYLAPTAWGIAGFILLKENAAWLDVFGAYEQLSYSAPFDNLPQTLTSVAFWVVLPFTIGIVRSLRREVK